MSFCPTDADGNIPASESPGARAVTLQALVYVFIGLACAGIGVTAYYALTFTPIEAAVTAIAFGAIFVVVLERALRRRAEARLEKAIEDLSRLLSTDAQAGAVLSQRINALTDVQAGRRLDAVEADVAVLGTVVRQVAEAVAELEQTGRYRSAPATAKVAHVDPDTFPEPVIPTELLRDALAADRLTCHFEPIVTLPMRRPHAYVLVPRLTLEDGELADPPDFMPRRGGADLVGQIEALCLAEAVIAARRARMGGGEVQLHVPLSRATLSEPRALEQLLATLEANRAILPSITFAISQADLRGLEGRGRTDLLGIARRGADLSIVAAATLRVDFAELQGLGVRSIELNAADFIDRPATLTDFHASDAAAYARRYGIELVGAGVVSEQQLLGLFEDGITLARGPYVGLPGPLRPEASFEGGVRSRPRSQRAEV